VTLLPYSYASSTELATPDRTAVAPIGRAPLRRLVCSGITHGTPSFGITGSWNIKPQETRKKA
jgi:hypothetical protein